MFSYWFTFQNLLAGSDVVSLGGLNWVLLGIIIFLLLLFYYFFIPLGIIFGREFGRETALEGEGGTGTFFLTRPKSPGPSPSNVCHACTC